LNSERIVWSATRAGVTSLLGLAEGLVRALQARQRLVGLPQRAFLLLERVLHGTLRVRPADLVDEDPHADADGEDGDQPRRLDGSHVALDLVGRDEREGRARRRHRQRGEERTSVPCGPFRRVLVHAAGHHRDQQRDE
jgi:hypothetical protein